MARRVSIREKAVLPSKGLIYDSKKKIPTEFEMRAMTTLEEKLRLSSNDSMQIIPELISRCSEPRLEGKSLTMKDLQYAMFRLRIVTYGPEYKVQLRCPHCGKEYEATIDLDALKINYLDPEVDGTTFEIGPLPINNDIITCRLMCVDDYDELAKDVKRVMAKMPNYEGDPDLILKYDYIITAINGESIEPYKIKEYIEKLHARDFRFLESKYEEKENSYGLDLYMIEKCVKCQGDVEFNLPINSEFFRPKY